MRDEPEIRLRSTPTKIKVKERANFTKILIVINRRICLLKSTVTVSIVTAGYNLGRDLFIVRPESSFPITVHCCVTDSVFNLSFYSCPFETGREVL